MSLDRLLDDFEAGHISREKLKQELLRQSFIETGSAKIDPLREWRTGGPEVVYCAGKTPDQAASIFDHLNRCNGRVLGTKADQGHYEAVSRVAEARFDPVSGLLTMMNSCAPGVGVVNIDNGFGAGYLAHKINMSALGKEDG
jgi:hypothetical protein